MATILILSGPNLNKLGTREPETYGHETLADIENKCRIAAQNYNVDIDFRQSNSEVELIEWIQDPPRDTIGVIINAAAYTHTSIAIHDALRLLSIPVIEVHLSNPHAREDFRHHSYITPVARGVISGFRGESYVLAVQAMADITNLSKQA